MNMHKKPVPNETVWLECKTNWIVMKEGWLLMLSLLPSLPYVLLPGCFTVENLPIR